VKVKKPRNLYSTGDVARLCGVTINTVVKWFEAGELKGKRTSATGARRITRRSLFSFLKRRGFPPDAAAAERFRILVVDDDEDVVSLFRKTFRNVYGYVVGVAGSSFEAGLLAERLKPHIVFLSVNLRGVRHADAARLLRANIGTHEVRVVATGRRIGKKRRESLSRHFDAILAKPFEVRQVRETIAACLS
jgi:CheY-like chemotaxis protein